MSRKPSEPHTRGGVRVNVLTAEEAKVWELSQRMYTQRRIADELGITQGAVSKILWRLNKRFLAEISEELAAVKGQIVAQYMHIADEAMQAWELSKKVRKSVGKTKEPVYTEDGKPVTVPGKDGGPARQLFRVVSATTKAETGAGDARYLAEAQRALDRICKLLGLDAPLEANLNIWREEAQAQGVDVDAAKEQLVNAFISGMLRAHSGGSLGGSEAAAIDTAGDSAKLRISNSTSQHN